MKKRELRWKVVKVISAKPKARRPATPAVEIHRTEAGAPLYVSYRTGVVVDGVFKSRNYIDARDAEEYVQLFHEAIAATAGLVTGTP